MIKSRISVSRFGAARNWLRKGTMRDQSILTQPREGCPSVNLHLD